MPHAPVPCIVVIRPVNADDPCLLRGPSGPLFPRLLEQLARLPEIGPVFLSAPASTPQAVRGQLAEAGLSVDYSAHELPQHRIQALMAEKGLDQALALTSYSYLLDAGEIAELCRLHGADGDMTFIKDGLALDHMVLVSRRAVDALVAAHPTSPVTPFYFAEYARAWLNLALRPLVRPYARGRRFLCELLLDPKRGLLPVAAMQAHFEENPPERWLDRSLHDQLLLRLAGAQGFGELERMLEKVDEQFRLLVTKQVRFMHRLKLLAPPGERFLELGFGASLLSSYCLLDTFSSGTAVEPFLENPEHLGNSQDLFRCLARHYPGTLPYTGGLERGGAPEKRLDVRLCGLEQASITPGSVDFCFSHVVFEHVKPVEQVSRELHRLLRPGGIMVHEIGLMDHSKNTNNIEFDFLRYSRQEWLAMNRSTNLWRVNDFVELWSGMGFDVDVVERHMRVVPPASLHPSWSVYAEQDLYCHKALVRAVRRN